MKSNPIRYRIQWGDTDAAGIVFYPNYFHWFDMATHEFFRSIGLPVAKLMKDGIVLPILNATSDFKMPLFYDDEVEVHSSIAEVRTKSFRIDHVVVRGADITGSGSEWRGWVLNEGRKLAAEPIPDHVRELFGH